MYATAEDLASWLQQDVDTATATLVLQTASALFSTRAATAFTPTTTTYEVAGLGYAQLHLPFRPIISVDEVRVAGQVITDYTRIKSVLYRLAGFGTPGAFPPDLLEVDLTHGFASVPDDVKEAVLESAGGAYSKPDVTVQSESIDDYSVSRAANTGGISLSQGAKDLADLYRGLLAA